MSPWRRSALILALVLASGAAAAQIPLPTEGEVIRVGEQIEVDLEGAAEAAIGSRILTMRPVDIGGRQVGVLTGVYRVIRIEWPNIRAVVDPERAVGLPGASRGDRAALESDGDPSELSITSEPEGARILWDGHLLGMTGDTLTVAPGAYTFAFEKADYEPAEYPFDVPVGQIRRESIVLDQGAGGDLLFESAKAKFGQCDFAAALALTTEAVQNGVGGDVLAEAFTMIKAMELAAPMAARARAQGAPEASVCDAGSAFHLWAKGERANDSETQDLACADLRRALPDDPLVRQTCR